MYIVFRMYCTSCYVEQSLFFQYLSGSVPGGRSEHLDQVLQQVLSSLDFLAVLEQGVHVLVHQEGETVVEVHGDVGLGGHCPGGLVGVANAQLGQVVGVHQHGGGGRKAEKEGESGLHYSSYLHFAPSPSPVHVGLLDEGVDGVSLLGQAADLPKSTVVSSAETGDGADLLLLGLQGVQGGVNGTENLQSRS